MSTRALTFLTLVMSLFLLIWALEVACTLSNARAEAHFKCQPTAEDEMGPFYRPGAEVRNEVGNGYLLLGTVKAAADCSGIANAQVELWMTGPQGFYSDEWRATLYSADDGKYYFKSHTATDYGARPPHIHIRVTADGYEELVTQHYPKIDAGMGMFDLVLIPQEQ